MKKAIITGASDGLGFEVAKILLAKDVEVVSLSRTKPKDSRIVHLKTDLASEKSIKMAVAKIKSNYADFDVLVNCAGVINVKSLGEIDYKETENLFRVNVIAPTFLISQLINLIKRNKADIVNVGSTVGFKAYKDQAAYGASKWGLRGLNENLRLELQDTKCRVIGFMPGGFRSRLVQKYTKSDADLSAYMDPVHVAELMVQILELPKTLEVSEIVVNRKTR